MFIRLTEQLRQVKNGTEKEPVAIATNRLFRYRPVDLFNYLEHFWAAAKGEDRYYGDEINEDERRSLAEPHQIGTSVVTPNVRPMVPGVVALPPPLPPPPSNPNDPPPPWTPTWRHLIYSFLIENTRILEVFRRVLDELFTGERLGRPNHVVMSWARTTEELFFTDRVGHWIVSPTSDLRRDAGSIRRNAYYRMFGMDLNHGLDEGRGYPFVKPEAANRDFAPTLEQLLREVWRGYVNRGNNSGPNTTDEASLASLAERLQDMLRDRRIYGALAREEFYCDALLSWFHVTVGSNNEVVNMLHAQGTNAAERLQNIGERVGLPPHSRSYHYFEMAEELADLLSAFELGRYTKPDAELTYGAPKLYDGRTEISSKVVTIVNHWSAASGRNLKEWVSEADASRPTYILSAAGMAAARAPAQLMRLPPAPR